MMIVYLILLLVFALIVYTLLQMWYKARYETFLFKDRRYLFNLVMFINNARAKGMEDKQIMNEIKGKKYWSGEQVTYALKKSRGERTGMFEIIPVERIFAYFRAKKAQKNIATGNMQQIPQKINKPFVPRNY